ncbi:MAG: hypothetical protein O2923_00450 [Verrucomicrobia bacterium]|nr:hypothetical protein [Verrucomicrobiota bacterium]MDA1085606.1 hypothetical protein [Verrucomicrobiota bacterium]
MHILLPLALTILNSTDVSYTEALCAPAVIHQCDLIVEATVTTTGSLETASMRLPKLDTSGFPKEIAKSRLERVTLLSYQAQVNAVYFDRKPSVTTAAVITVSTLHNVVPYSDAALTRVQGYKNHRLRNGTRYMLLLRELPDAPGRYYLPYNRHCVIEPNRITAHFGENFADVLNPEKWNWSEPDERGLQAAALVRSPVRRSATNSIDFQVALRQGTDASIQLLLHPGLRPIQLEIRHANGEPTEIQPDLYAKEMPLDPRAVVPYSLQPGQILFIRENGPALQWTTASPALPPGSYSLQSRYSIPVTNQVPEIYWRGTIETPPATFEILPGDAPPAEAVP